MGDYIVELTKVELQVVFAELSAVIQRCSNKGDCSDCETMSAVAVKFSAALAER